MTQPLPAGEIVIGLNPTGIEIRFQRSQQAIQAWIQNRTLRQIDDAVGSTTEVPHAQTTAVLPSQWNQATVAVADAPLISQGRVGGMVNATDPVQRLGQGVLFPAALCGFLEMLQGAAPAVAGEDAGRMATGR